MEYRTKEGRAGYGEAPNDAAQSVCAYIYDLLSRAAEHDSHLSLLVGSLFSSQLAEVFRSYSCDVAELIRCHLSKPENRGIIRVLIWRAIESDGTVPIDDSFVELLREFPERFEVRMSNTDQESENISHFILASPISGESDLRVVDGGPVLPRGGWGLRIERPHGPAETKRFAAWNSFAFDRVAECQDYLVVEKGYRLLGFFNSIWKKAVVISPAFVAA